MLRQHVSHEELQALSLDGIPLSPDARQHFDACSDCQQQVIRARQASAYLVSRLYRSQCPSATTLSYYCLPNVLSKEEQLQVTNHLAHCPRCLAEFGESRQFLKRSEGW